MELKDCVTQVIYAYEYLSDDMKNCSIQERMTLLNFAVNMWNATHCTVKGDVEMNGDVGVVER